jgi:hypothetical protein
LLRGQLPTVNHEVWGVILSDIGEGNEGEFSGSGIHLGSYLLHH